MPIVRSIGGILAGCVVIFLLVGIVDLAGGMLFNALPDPDTGTLSPEANTTGLSVWNLAWYFVITLLGAWLAARIAGRRPMLHAGIIALLILGGGVAFALFGKAAYEALGIELPSWYLPLLPVVGAIGALTGGWLRARRQPGGT
ncbi:MAG: hypothetical protein HKO59_16225 [Phycisphaerales bacterium]|nr:hypothetical protein [Phycisphaerae bacterium]NNF42568.1 hypothetical protein [Phycisphaerales bacterium]NNM27499.1 hypothetical protein [Phycisphaerales bacterium]